MAVSSHTSIHTCTDYIIIYQAKLTVLSLFSIFSFAKYLLSVVSCIVGVAVDFRLNYGRDFNKSAKIITVSRNRERIAMVRVFAHTQYLLYACVPLNTEFGPTVRVLYLYWQKFMFFDYIIFVD